MNDHALEVDQHKNVLLRAVGVSKSYETSVIPSHLFFEKMLGLKATRERFEALKPLDIEVKRGVSVGILGRNGAGKSTLLSVLSGIAKPTTGHVEHVGRVAALIGIGQSFNADESGRYNAERFCRVLGLPKEKIIEAIGKIHEFSELGDFFDRPVKTYSSGMKARLNFSCATFVDADLIIIDEVLAVGDAEFRSKCHGHIEASIERGQTYVMVSHSPAMIGNYCDRALVIEQGELIFDGDPLGGMQAYADITNIQARRKRSSRELMQLRAQNAGAAIPQAAIAMRSVTLDAPGRQVSTDQDDDSADMAGGKVIIRSGGKGSIGLSFDVLEDIPAPRIAAGWRNGKGLIVAGFSEKLSSETWRAGERRDLVISFEPRMTVGNYLLRFSVATLESGGKELLYESESLLELQIIDGCRSGLVDIGFKLESSLLADNEKMEISS